MQHDHLATYDCPHFDWDDSSQRYGRLPGCDVCRTEERQRNRLSSQRRPGQIEGASSASRRPLSWRARAATDLHTSSSLTEKGNSSSETRWIRTLSSARSMEA